MTGKDSAPAFLGRLGSIGVQDVMGFLATLRLNGALEVESTDGALVIYFREGDVVWARAVRGGIDPGELLLRGDWIRADRLAAMRTEGVADGDLYDVLAAAGSLPGEDLEKLRGEELYENVLRLFNWSPGEFRFYEGTELPAEAHPIRIEVQGLLLEAARRCDEWSRLPTLFSDPESRFELRADPKNDENISLGLEEWRLLYLVTGGHSLEQIWEASPLGSRLETSRLLYGLASARLLRPVGAAGELPEGALDADGSFSLTSKTFAEATDGPREAPAGGDEEKTAPSRPAAVPPEAPPVTAAPPTAPPAIEGLETIRLPGPGPDDTLATLPAEARSSRLTRSQIRVEPRARLVTLGEGEARTYPLTSPLVRLGRAADNDLILHDHHVSGHHASILQDGDHFVIEDAGSSNGVTVNGRRTLRSYLRGGEEIEIYPYRFRFELDFDVVESGRLAQGLPA